MPDSPDKPRRLRRLDRVFDAEASYFITICTKNRARVLNNPAVFKNVQTFAAGSPERYGVYADSYVLMPDHIHLIITISRTSETTVGKWVKAYKAMTAKHQFKWQAGFFDHVLRSDESRSEKWEYIRMNPVRAGLVETPEEWPYAQRFNQYDGAEM